MFSQDVTIAWAPPSTRKSSLFVNQLLRTAARQNIRAVALVKWRNDECITYEEAMYNLPSTPDETVLILDEADTMDTTVAACLMKIATTAHKIILIVSFVESGWALAKFLRPASSPNVIEWEDRATANAPDVQYMPQYHDDAVQAAVHFANEQGEFTVVIFAGCQRIAKAIAGELDYAIVVHDRKPAPQELEKNRVVVVTDAGQDFMTSEYLMGHSVIDTGIAIGTDDRGAHYQGIITRFESARRIGRAHHTCICFYEPSMLTQSALMSTHRVHRVRALCLAGGGASVFEIQNALDWRPAMRECIGRGFLSHNGTLRHIGIAMANMCMDSCLVHLIDEAMRLGFLQRGAILAVMINAQCLPTQPMDSILRPSPTIRLSKAEHRNYANIMTIFGQPHAFPAYVPEQEVFVDAVARCMHNHRCVRIEGPWYYCPFLRRLLRTQHPLPETNDITCLLREGNKIRSFVILPTTSKTALLSIPAEGIPGLERYVYVHRNIMARKGIYVACRRKDTVRVICVAGLEEAHRCIVTTWIDALRAQNTLAPKEIKTHSPDVCLVVSSGGRITDVTLRNEKVSIVLPHFRDMSRYLPEHTRVTPNENGTVKITVHTKEQLQELFNHCEIASIDAATTRVNRRPPPSIRIIIRVCFSWAVAESRLEAVVTKIPESGMAEWTDKLPHTVSAIVERDHVVLKDIPRLWDERDISEILGVDVSAVTIRRGKVLGANKQLPAYVNTFLETVRRANPTTAPHSDLINEYGVRNYSVEIPSTDAVSFVIQTQQRILPNTVLYQRPRAWIKIEVVPHAINPVFWTQLTRTQDTSWTVDIDHIPGNNENTFQEFIGVFTGIDRLQQIAEPLVFYDPGLCHLRSIPRVSPLFVERVGIATFHIYGPEEKRQGVIELLKNRAAKPCKTPDNTCEICFTAYPDYVLTACRHRFCSECMCHTVNACADQQLPFLCPATDCREPMAWDNVEQLCCPNKMTMWVGQQVRSLAVKRPDLVRLCPGCETVVETRSSSNNYICTSCKTTWCLNCSSMSGEATKAHKGPCNAQERHEELAKLKDAGVYPCPSCLTPIVKTEGCSHVKCDMRDCRADFCWLCMQQFSPIHSYRSMGALHTTVGVIEFINYEKDTAVVKIIPDTWKVQCPMPTNDTLILRLSYLQPVVIGTDLETWTKVIVETEIYEHIAQCGRPVNS
jgi:hypothetical protein